MPSQVFVKTLSGTLCVQDVATVAELKTVVEAREGVCVEDQRLIFAGKQWEDAEALPEEEDATFFLTASLDGGGKKRKKKTYTKPKKIKHKHKKVKLAVLKYYRVDQASGKVTRLRKECPHPDCGAGVFMGLHYNRHYCGKCGLTYMITGDEAGAGAKGGKKGKK